MDDDEPLLLLLLSNFPVIGESFLAAETMLEVLQGFDGKRVGRWRGRWVYGVVVGMLPRIGVLWKAISVCAGGFGLIKESAFSGIGR